MARARRNRALGERLRACRDKLGRTLEDVAPQVGCAVPTLQRYEAQGRIPEADIFWKLATLYGVDPKYLLFGPEGGTSEVAAAEEGPGRGLDRADAKFLQEVEAWMRRTSARVKRILRLQFHMVKQTYGGPEEKRPAGAEEKEGEAFVY